MSSAREFAEKLLDATVFYKDGSASKFYFVAEELIESRDAEREKELRAELARYKAACEAGMKLQTKWQSASQDVGRFTVDERLQLRRLSDELRAVLKAATEGE